MATRLAPLIASVHDNPTHNHLVRKELDSYANMIVVGKNSIIFDDTGKTCTVNAFSESAGKLHNIPIIDAVIAYDCPYQCKTFLLLMRNALYIPELVINLLPPFIVRESGIQIDECPKIQTTNPTIDNHSMFIHEHNLRIPFKLINTFSYFETRKPTMEELQTCDKIFITPDSSSWDPYNQHYARNEDIMLDEDGNMREVEGRQKYIVEDHEISYFDLPTIDAVEAQINSLLKDSHLEYQTKGGTICHSSAELNAQKIVSKLEDWALRYNISSAIGNTVIGENSCILFSTSYDELDNKFSSSISSLSANNSKGVSPEFLEKIWCITPEQASDAITRNSQHNRQSTEGMLSRHFSTNDRMLRYRRIKSNFFTDTMFVTKSAKSLRGYTMLQLFVSDKGYISVYPMEKKSDFRDCLHLFCKEVGVPEILVVDPSGEQTSKPVRRFCIQVGTTLKLLEESTQWANRAELYVGLLKESIRQDLRKSHCPMILWDYCAQRRALIHNLTPRDLFSTYKQTPYEFQFGIQGDMSNLCNFGWYDWCYYREESNNVFPRQKELLGRVLGPSKNEGNEMAQNILNVHGHVIPRRSVRRLTQAELNSQVEKEKRNDFDRIIKDKLGDSLNLPSKPITHNPMEPESGEKVENEIDCIIDENPTDAVDETSLEYSFLDTFIHAEVLLPHNGQIHRAIVKGRHKDENCEVSGQYNVNPLLNTIIYDVEFSDRTVKEYAANIIAQNLHSIIESDGNRKGLLEAILDHKVDSNVTSKANKHVTTSSGRKRIPKSTAGWKLLVRWNDGCEEWITLGKMKRNFPIQVAQYAVAQRISNEPVFSWWVPYTLKKCEAIVSSVRSRATKSNHKYGVRVPTSIKDAIELDSENNNTLWRNSIDLEMRTILPAFDILPHGSHPPAGYTKSSGHIIFDVKMDFTRKSRWVKDGHLTDDPLESNFAGVVSRESVRIAFTYAALNELKVYAADIKSAYLQAPTSEKHYIICGEEFPMEHRGCIGIIKRALYGGKCAGADYWKHMRSCMNHLGFIPCKTDPDVWMRSAIKDSDGTSY